jgi:hypothetical protein
MITWLGYRKKQISFSVAKRRLTQSRWSFLGLFRLAVVAITAFSSLPLQAVTFLGGLFLFCAVLFSGYSLFLYFIGLARPGFTTVIILELLIGGVLMISLGIIGTYIAQIYQEVKYRPRTLLQKLSPVAVMTSYRMLRKSAGQSRLLPWPANRQFDFCVACW